MPFSTCFCLEACILSLHLTEPCICSKLKQQLFLADAPHMIAAFSKSGPEGVYENFASAVLPLSTIHHPQLYLHWESNDLKPDV